MKLTKVVQENQKKLFKMTRNYAIQCSKNYQRSTRIRLVGTFIIFKNTKRAKNFKRKIYAKKLFKITGQSLSDEELRQTSLRNNWKISAKDIKNHFKTLFSLFFYG